jgi:hypothetical protein
METELNDRAVTTNEQLVVAVPALVYISSSVCIVIIATNGVWIRPRRRGSTLGNDAGVDIVVVSSCN